MKANGASKTPVKIASNIAFSTLTTPSKHVRRLPYYGEEGGEKKMKEEMTGEDGEEKMITRNIQSTGTPAGGSPSCTMTPSSSPAFT